MVSQTVKQRCLISYPDNPQKDYLELAGIINFPNLAFDTKTVDFGCVLMDSMRRISVGVMNPSSVPVEYSWSWISQDRPVGEAGRCLGTALTVVCFALQKVHTSLHNAIALHTAWVNC